MTYRCGIAPGSDEPVATSTDSSRATELTQENAERCRERASMGGPPRQQSIDAGSPRGPEGPSLPDATTPTPAGETKPSTARGQDDVVRVAACRGSHIGRHEWTNGVCNHCDETRDVLKGTRFARPSGRKLGDAVEEMPLGVCIRCDAILKAEDVEDRASTDLPNADPADEAIVDRLVAAKTSPGKPMSARNASVYECPHGYTSDACTACAYEEREEELRSFVRMELAIREIVEEWKVQATVDEEGWSYRRGNNDFNLGAASVLRHYVEELEVLLAPVASPMPCVAVKADSDVVDSVPLAAYNDLRAAVEKTIEAGPAGVMRDGLGHLRNAYDALSIPGRDREAAPSSCAAPGSYAVAILDDPEDDCRRVLHVERNGKVIRSESDGGEPEDQSFYRDWSWVEDALREAYLFGLEDGRSSQSSRAAAGSK